VTDIFIECIDDLFFVSGSINGLTSEYDILIRNNGGDTQILSSNGAFVFATTLRDLESYDVSFEMLPVVSERACEITANIGNISGNNIDDITISCHFSNDMIYENGFE
jgi:hypothetical protein